MDSKNFRTGNVVLYGEKELGRIEPGDISLYSEALNKRTIGVLKPVNLTIEWLENLGFERMNNGKYYCKYFGLGTWIMVETKEMGYWIGTGDWNDNDHSSIGLGNIKHVHQLQNLFFALAQKELELEHDV